MFVSRKSSIFAAVAAILAASHFTEIDPEAFKTEEIAVYSQTAGELFDFVTDTRNVPTVRILMDLETQKITIFIVVALL